MPPKREKTAIMRETEVLPRSPEDVIAEAIGGLVKFNRQLIEACAHKDTMLMQVVVQQQMQMAEFWRTENERLKAAADHKKLTEELLDKKAEREERAKDKEAARELRESGIAGALALLPKVVNKMIGAPALSETEIGTLMPLLSNLKQHELEAMANALPLEKRIAFQSVVQAFLEIADKEEAAKKAANGKADHAADN